MATEHGSWLSLAGITAVATAAATAIASLLGRGRGEGQLTQRVNDHERRLDEHDDILREKISRDEFNQAMKRLDGIHDDVREIRRAVSP